jgi:hypothetical protein
MMPAPRDTGFLQQGFLSAYDKRAEFHPRHGKDGNGQCRKPHQPERTYEKRDEKPRDTAERTYKYQNGNAEDGNNDR